MEFLDLDDCVLVKKDQHAVEDLVITAFFCLHLKFGESQSYYDAVGEVLASLGTRNMAASLGPYPTAEKVAAYPQVMACRCGHVQDSSALGASYYVESCEHCQGDWQQVKAPEMIPSGLCIKTGMSKAWALWAVAQGLRLMKVRSERHV